MKQRIIFHYLLFLAVIIGGFASMAQNNYGLTIISTSCVLFSISLLIELIQKMKSFPWAKLMELLSLSVLFSLFGLRAAYIHFIYVEWLLMLVCTILIAIYSINGLARAKDLGSDNIRIRNLVLVYYLSLIGFTLSIIITMIVPILSEPLGGLSAALLGILIIGLYFSRTQIINGVEVNPANYLSKQAGHSIILMTGYLLISLYSGLHMIGIFPSLYTNKLPQVYIELINQAESGKETPVDGVYQHELYKEAYDKFMAKHGEEE